MKWNKLEIWLIRLIARSRPVMLNLQYVGDKINPPTMKDGLIAYCSWIDKK